MSHTKGWRPLKDNEPFRPEDRWTFLPDKFVDIDQLFPVSDALSVYPGDTLAAYRRRHLESENEKLRVYRRTEK